MKDMKALQNGSDIRGIALPVEGYEVNLTTDMVKRKRRSQPIQIKNGRLGLVMTVG